MRTEILRADDPAQLARAAAHLRAGRLVAFPTETVYGLGARAGDERALAELRRVKGRPEEKPFALLIAEPADMERFAAPGPAARRLAARFWPGPLTLVVADGRGGDVGLRCPALKAARELVRLSGGPVAAPSANRSGEPPARSAQEALRVFDGRIAAVLDGGPVGAGVASTVVRAMGEEVEILRPGALTEGQIRGALQEGA
jgi:L-threonylcarbamoyladenylate synthase